MHGTDEMVNVRVSILVFFLVRGGSREGKVTSFVFSLCCCYDMCSLLLCVCLLGSKRTPEAINRKKRETTEYL